MKNTFLTFLVVFVATLAVGQTEPDDKTKLLGAWRIHEIINEGELTMSRDPKNHKKIIDDAWAKDSVILKEMGMDKAALVESMEEQSEMFSKITFVFGKKGKVSVSANDGKSKDVYSPYTVNEEKHEIIIEEENKDKLIYQYMIFDDLLILKQENDTLIFKRKA